MKGRHGEKTCRALFTFNTNLTSSLDEAQTQVYDMKSLIAYPLKDPSVQVIPDPTKHIGSTVVVLKGKYAHRLHPKHNTPVHRFGKLQSVSSDGSVVYVQFHNTSTETTTKKFRPEMLHVLSAAGSSDGPNEVAKHVEHVPLQKIGSWLADFKRNNMIDVRLVRGNSADIANKLSGTVTDVGWRVDFKCFRSGLPSAPTNNTFTSIDRMCKAGDKFKGVGCTWGMTIRYNPKGNEEQRVTVTYDHRHNNHKLGSPEDLKLLDPDDGLKAKAMDMIAAGMRPTLILHKIDEYVDCLATIHDPDNAHLYSFECRRFRWTLDMIYNLKKQFELQRRIHSDDGCALEMLVKVCFMCPLQ